MTFHTCILCHPSHKTGSPTQLPSQVVRHNSNGVIRVSLQIGDIGDNRFLDTFR